MSKQLAGFFVTLLIAVVWGYFSDLRHGQVGWFIGRIIFMLGIAYLWSRLSSISEK